MMSSFSLIYLCCSVLGFFSIFIKALSCVFAIPSRLTRKSTLSSIYLSLSALTSASSFSSFSIIFFFCSIIACLKAAFLSKLDFTNFLSPFLWTLYLFLLQIHT
jgi:hypothetical protein